MSNSKLYEFKILQSIHCHMRISFSISVYILFALKVCAQTQSIATHKNTPKAGDVISKQQVEFKDPGASGRNITWDFSVLNPVDENYKVRYLYRTKKDTGQYIVNEHQTSYRYQMKHDTLWLHEFKNRTTTMMFIKPEAQLKLPLTYGDTLVSEFEGIGKYCETVDIFAKGKAEVTVDAMGEIITPSLQVLKNVIRVHRERTYSEIDVDSASLKLDVYSWYVNGFRYPVFETFISTVTKNDSIFEDFKTSFFYSDYTIDSLFTSTKNTTEIEKVFTEATLLPNPVSSNLLISYNLTRPAQIWFSVHNNGGVLVRQTSPQMMPGGFNQCSIPMSAVATGSYTVYIHVDNLTMQRVIIKL